ncbi:MULTISPECIES: hypothetical protein [Streptomyces rochei group]|uniref:hypothetical protein n=1 Tax=Streptomyces rochei group TaxID=2867164 RepID=UPI001876D18E|nr:hypothetical protein [Streptomyces vinaceusdrappus]GHC26998.1 hypothetical protein GCM10010308_49880 [Streptomyces vinaceusdrappus]
MTEELLTPDELTDRCWAVTAAAAEGRHEDVDELLVTLPWDDLVTVVFTVAQLGVGLLSGGADPRDQEARARVADRLRGFLLERLAEREGPADDARG